MTTKAIVHDLADGVMGETWDVQVTVRLFRRTRPAVKANKHRYGR